MGGGPSSGECSSSCFDRGYENGYNAGRASCPPGQCILRPGGIPDDGLTQTFTYNDKPIAVTRLHGINTFQVTADEGLPDGCRFNPMFEDRQHISCDAFEAQADATGWNSCDVPLLSSSKKNAVVLCDGYADAGKTCSLDAKDADQCAPPGSCWQIDAAGNAHCAMEAGTPQLCVPSEKKHVGLPPT